MFDDLPQMVFFTLLLGALLLIAAKLLDS